MPVDSHHPDYAAALPLWAKCRDAAAGQECVHHGGPQYLPRLSEQTQEEYDAYRGRALYYNATGRTVDGLTGLVFRRPPKIEVPADLEYLLDDVDTAGTPLVAFCEKAVDELVKTGRFGLLADFPTVGEEVRTRAQEVAVGARPYLTLFRAESVANWRQERVGGRWQLTLVVIEEKVAEAKDDYTMDCVDQMRVLRLVGGQYIVELHRRKKGADGRTGEWVLFNTLQPKIAGAPLDFIPFLFCNPTGVSADVDKPPILDLTNVNLSHYRTSADYEHGLHFTGLPTPYITGHTFGEGERFALGSTAVKGFANPNAQLGFLEFTGAGLASLSKRLEEKEAMMAALGARMLGAEKRAAEAAETAAIHRSGENSVLASLAIAAGAALSKALGWCVLWARAAGEVKVELNTDYIPAGMTAQELTALVAAWQQGAIAFETLYDNLQRGEIARQGVDADEEKEKIDEEGPALGTMEDEGAPPAGGPPKQEPEGGAT